MNHKRMHNLIGELTIRAHGALSCTGTLLSERPFRSFTSAKAFHQQAQSHTFHDGADDAGCPCKPTVALCPGRPATSRFGRPRFEFPHSRGAACSIWWILAMLSKSRCTRSCLQRSRPSSRVMSGLAYPNSVCTPQAAAHRRVDSGVFITDQERAAPNHCLGSLLTSPRRHSRVGPEAATFRRYHLCLASFMCCPTSFGWWSMPVVDCGVTPSGRKECCVRPLGV